MAFASVKTEDLEEQLQAGPCAHLSDPSIAALIDGDVSPTLLEFIQQHLQSCADCRIAVRCELSAAGVASTHPLLTAVKRAEEWAQMAAAGKEATRLARAELHRQGINPVFSQDGVLMEELPDGSARPRQQKIDSAA